MWLVLGMLLLAAPALAQSSDAGPGLDDLARVERVRIDRVVAGRGGESVVEVTLRVLTADGEPVEALRPVDFRVWQSDEPVETSEFEVSALGPSSDGLAIVLAIDASRRSLGGAFERGVAAALTLIERAGQEEDIAIVLFSDTVDVIVPFGTSPREARSRLEALHLDAMASGGLLFSGVLESIELIRARLGDGGRGFVIVASSGFDAGSEQGPDRVLAASVGREGEPRIPVFTIAELGAAPEGIAALRRIAEGSGASLMLSSGQSFAPLLGTIWRQMLRGYRLSFPAELDGRRHRIDVAIDGQMTSAKLSYPKREVSSRPYLAIAGFALLLLAAAVVVLVLQRRPQPARLVVLTGSHAGNVIKLSEGRHRVGSLAENDVVLESAGVSRHHAEIIVEPEGAQVHDLNSKNGTRVNGVAREFSPLMPGDRVDFAEVRMVYERGKPAKSRKTSAR